MEASIFLLFWVTRFTPLVIFTDGDALEEYSLF